MYILFDIGGTKTRIAASRDCKEFIEEPKVVETPKDFDEGMQLFKELVQELCKGEKVEIAGGGVAGPLNKERTQLLNSPNISGWIGKPLKEELSKVLGAPVYLANDSAIVGLGEAHFGAGKGHEIVVYITVSTGVGGARIVHGKIDERVYGFEPGHQYIDIDRTLCPECKSGQLEDLISGTAVALRFGKKAYEISDRSLWEHELPHWFGYGLANTIMHWSPDVVVLGGSMIVGDPSISVPHVTKCVRDFLTIIPEIPEIKKAELKDFGGLYGAMVFINQNK